jgi:hypothetical protein
MDHSQWIVLSPNKTDMNFTRPLVLTLSISISVASIAQNNKQLADFIDKRASKGKGFITTPAPKIKAPSFKEPKRIGLLVFALYDHPTYTGSDTWHKYYEQFTQDASNSVTQTIYDACIDDLKAEFIKNGLTLLTTEEYLDTEVKQNMYDTMNMRVMGLAKIAESGTNLKGQGLPEGYRYIHNSMSHSDPGGRADLINPLTEIGLDGYLSVFIQMKGQHQISFVSTNLMFFGDREYTSKIKKQTYRRTDLASHILPLRSTKLDAADAEKLVQTKKGSDQNMVDFVDGKVVIDPNISKLISASVSSYFPLTK